MWRLANEIPSLFGDYKNQSAFGTPGSKGSPASCKYLMLYAMVGALHSFDNSLNEDKN
jgi:hypothetical protein